MEMQGRAAGFASWLLSGGHGQAVGTHQPLFSHWPISLHSLFQRLPGFLEYTLQLQTPGGCEMGLTPLVPSYCTQSLRALTKHCPVSPTSPCGIPTQADTPLTAGNSTEHGRRMTVVCWSQTPPCQHGAGSGVLALVPWNSAAAEASPQYLLMPLHCCSCQQVEGQAGKAHGLQCIFSANNPRQFALFGSHGSLQCNPTNGRFIWLTCVLLAWTAKRDCQHFVGCPCGCLLLKIINKRCMELLGKCGVSRDDLFLALLCFLWHVSRQCSRAAVLWSRWIGLRSEQVGYNGNSHFQGLLKTRVFLWSACRRGWSQTTCQLFGHISQWFLSHVQDSELGSDKKQKRIKPAATEAWLYWTERSTPVNEGCYHTSPAEGLLLGPTHGQECSPDLCPYLLCRMAPASMCSTKAALPRRCCPSISSTTTWPALSGSWTCVSAAPRAQDMWAPQIWSVAGGASGTGGMGENCAEKSLESHVCDFLWRYWICQRGSASQIPEQRSPCVYLKFQHGISVRLHFRMWAKKFHLPGVLLLLHWFDDLLLLIFHLILYGALSSC